MSTFQTQRQPNPKQNFSKPFTPQAQANNQAPQAPPGAQVSYQAQNQQQQPNPNRMYMSQPQVAAVLTQQPPPQPPPLSQTQSSQPGQNSAGSRGVPPPPPQQQAQNYPTQNTQTQNQPAAPPQPGQAVFIPGQPFSANPDMYQYQRSLPYQLPGQGQNSQNVFFVNPNYVLQNHPQTAHFDSTHVQNVPQPHPQAYITSGTQGMYATPPFLSFQQPAQWMPQHIPPQHTIHRANLAAPQTATAQSTPASQPTASQGTSNSQTAQPTDNMNPTIPHYQAQQIAGVVPPTMGYPTFTPMNQIMPPAQPQAQTYQKRERKPLLIVDPSTKQPINNPTSKTTTIQRANLAAPPTATANPTYDHTSNSQADPIFDSICL
jgi:hypothetical protein